MQARQIRERVDAIFETEERDIIEHPPRISIAALNAQIGRRVMRVGEPARVNERGEARGDRRIEARPRRRRFGGRRHGCGRRSGCRG